LGGQKDLGARSKKGGEGGSEAPETQNGPRGESLTQVIFPGERNKRETNASRVGTDRTLPSQQTRSPSGPERGKTLGEFPTPEIRDTAGGKKSSRKTGQKSASKNQTSDTETGKWGEKEKKTPSRSGTRRERKLPETSSNLGGPPGRRLGRKERNAREK